MPMHFVVVQIELKDASGDTQSPSQFVQAVEDMEKDLLTEHETELIDVFRTTGRFDAVVFLDGDPLASLEIVGIDGVRRGETLVGPPGGHDHEDG